MNLFADDSLKPSDRLLFTQERRLKIYPWVIFILIVAFMAWDFLR